MSIAITSVGWRICLGMGRVVGGSAPGPPLADALIRNVRARSSRKDCQDGAAKARRMTRLCEHLLPSALPAGGEPGSRLSRNSACRSAATRLLRMVRVAACEPISAPRVVGVDDWAWRKGQRYGTIICDLERNRVLDLLPDRNATRSHHGWAATRASR
ncbi:hypothetical protein F2981_31280 (plasmid) [Sinorhizobium meliloti]|nr:hypothetical protein [Sinorhizobium meliloti]